MVPVIVLQSVLAAVSLLALAASWRFFVHTRRERKMCSGMLNACREHRADCRRDVARAKDCAASAKYSAETAKKAATIEPFTRDLHL